MNLTLSQLQQEVPLSLFVRKNNLIDFRYKIKDGAILPTQTIYFSCDNPTTDSVTTVRLDDSVLSELYIVRKNPYKGFECIKKLPHDPMSVFQSWSISEKKFTHIYCVLNEDFYDTLIPKEVIKMGRFVVRVNRDRIIDQIYVEYRNSDFEALSLILDPKVFTSFVDSLKEKPHRFIFYCNAQSNWKALGFLAEYYGSFKEDQHFEIGLEQFYANADVISYNLSKILA